MWRDAPLSHVRNVTEMRQLSLELSGWDVRRTIHMPEHESLGLEICSCANSMRFVSANSLFASMKSAQLAGLIISQSFRTSAALSILLYNSHGWTFLLSSFHVSFCEYSSHFFVKS